MFWALVVEPNKLYTQVISKSFHVSMACLDVETAADNEITSLMLEVGDEKLILCNLSKNKYVQQPLDLNFQTGDEISFYIKGKATVHLTGYLIVGEDFPGLSSDPESDEEEEEDDEEEAKEALKMKASKAMKRGLEVKSLKNKKAKLDPAADEGDSDDDDEDFDIDEDSTDEEASEEQEPASGSGEEEESEDEEVDMSQLKKGKKEVKKTSGKEEKKESGVADKKNESMNGTPNLSAKKKKLKEGALKVKAGSPAESPKTPKTDEMQKKTVMGGVAIEDLKIGGGPVAKAGRMVTVYYVGRLKHNNKQFDSTQQGPGFKFRLGSNEVIKGWDLGIAGMKVGGKRKIMCPPNMAYGSKGSPPIIPPNSTLVFEVELRSVN